MPNQYSAKNELVDARAALKLLEDEAAELRGKLHAAALDGNREEYSRLQMAETSLPMRRSEAERRLLPLELAYAEQQREKLLAKRAEATARIMEASERVQTAQREVRLAQGQRESTTYEIGQLSSKIKDLSWKAERLGTTAPAALEEVTT